MRRASLFLAGLCAFGAAGALAQDRPAPEGLAPPAAEAPDAAALNPLATLDKSALTGFRDMPLFTPSRKRPTPPPPEVEVAAPEPEPEAPAAAPETPEPELKLSGVIEGPEGAVAVVQKEGGTERLRLGDQVDGWLVTGIEGVSLKLTLNEREKEYRLFQRAEGSETSKGEGEADKPEGESVEGPGGGDMPGSDQNEPDASGAAPDPSVDTPEGEQPPADQPDDASKDDPADEAK